MSSSFFFRFSRIFFNVNNCRVMTVETWDGRTKYKVLESAGEETDRIDQWEKYLEGEEEEEK